MIFFLSENRPSPQALMKIKIRKAEMHDIDSIAALSLELGYRPEKSEIEIKLVKFSPDPNEAVYVAETDKVLGWMHISHVEPLESKPFVEIRGIVVDQEYRGKGIGTQLIVKAEEWAKERGCSKIRVRTNIEREETRQYYRRLNFISKKTQEVFEKEL